MRLHPYSIITALCVALGTLIVLRHPVFAFFAGALTLMGMDALLKGSGKDKLDPPQ